MQTLVAMAPPGVNPILLRHRRRGLLLAAALLVPLHLVDRLLGRVSLASVALDALWVGMLAATALLQRPDRPRVANGAARVAALASGILFSLVAAVTGGSASPYLYYALTLPASSLLLVPDLPSVAALTTLATVGGQLVLLTRGQSPRYLAALSYMAIAACVVIGVGAWLCSRLARSEANAERARADAEHVRAVQAMAIAEEGQRQERAAAAAQAEATRSRDNLRKILESLPDVVVVSRPDGSVVFVNGHGQEMFGIEPGSPITTGSVSDRVVAEDRPLLLRRREAFAAGRDPGTDRIRVVGQRGIRDCEIHGVVTEFDGASAVVTVVRDVTERHELDRRLALAERMASVGTLAAGVAHEINNPLSYVLSNLRFLRDELAPTERDDAGRVEARGAASEALEGAERVRRIVLDLHTFAHPGQEESAVDLHGVLDRAITIASSEIRFRARVVKDYGVVPRVRGSASRLGQLALNLIVNAAQAIPSGRPEENEIRVVTRPDASGRTVVEFRDTGCGIAPEVRSRIFEPFFTTKPVGTGTGLGLSICHGIVSAVGGEISVDSEVGKGSVFRVVLPAYEDEHDATPSRPSTEAA